MAMRIAFAWIAQQQPHNGKVRGRHVPVAQNLLAIRVGKCRPALADIAGANT